MNTTSASYARSSFVRARCPDASARTRTDFTRIVPEVKISFTCVALARAGSPVTRTRVAIAVAVAVVDRAVAVTRVMTIRRHIRLGTFARER